MSGVDSIRASSVSKVVAAVRDLRVSPALAISRILGFDTISEYAAAIGKQRHEVSQCLLVKPHRIYPEIRDVTARKLGISRAKFDDLIEDLNIMWPEER